MSITLPAIETEISTIWHASINRAAAIFSAASVIITKVDNVAQELGALAMPFLAAAAPQDAAALSVVLAAIKWIDTLASDASVDLAALEKGFPGISALVAEFQKAKADLIKFESVL